MPYRSLRECVEDLEKHGQLVRISKEVDPNLEMAAIHRKYFRESGPAVFYEKVKGSPFPAVSNLFGTMERARFIFRENLDTLKKIFQLKARPTDFFRNPLAYCSIPFALWNGLPHKTITGSVFECETTIDQLPQIKCWPQDGGAFILLPQVYTEDLDEPGIMKSNLGMYRIQLSGNEYIPNQEAGLHYQIRRDIGIHHMKAVQARQPLRVSIFVGGPPAHTFAAIMYLPAGLPEIAFAGVLGGRRFHYAVRDGFTISTDADFCITGWVDPNATKPEGPFGDHLGYYSLQHAFPYLKVEKVYHRKDAIWPFTVVGRPPQEDSVFGKLVQEIAGPMIPKEIPGVKAVHAVDASGVHPLMLAIASERYVPYQQERKPQELLTLSNALLGYGPCSLAKYLMMACAEDSPTLDIHNIPKFFKHILERIDWAQDLHFQTETTIDTLDYSGTGLNAGSKVVMVAAGKKRRELSAELPRGMKLTEGFETPQSMMPGIFVLKAPEFRSYESSSPEIEIWAKLLESSENMQGVALLVLVDDPDFCAQSFENFLWVTFTRSNPSHDIYGVGNFIRAKHWGCRGPLIIDARMKPHHAPALESAAEIERSVASLAIAQKSI